MNKEFNPSWIQRALWEPLGGNQGVQRRISHAKKGWLPYGKTIDEIPYGNKQLLEMLGEFAPKVIIASSPENPFTLIPEQIAVAGGWCALRTKDIEALGNKGIIMNPQSGVIEQVKSVDQVATWVKQAVSFDQIVESIGAVEASEYASISERRLWSQRLIQKLEVIFNKKLSPDEQQKIEQSVENAEQTRSSITEKYLQYVTGKNGITFQRVVDDDIWEDLNRARDEMLLIAGLSLEKLQRSFPDQASSIPTSSLVWAMYSEPYFDMLRQKGVIKSKKVFIVEPAMHATVESLPETELAQRIYRDKGVYLDPSGFNSDTGFIAYIECVNERGKNVRKEQLVGEVPNIMNWKLLFEKGFLDPEKNATLNPADNKVYIWGVNFLPFGSNLSALIEIVELQQQYKAEKAKLAQQFAGEIKNGNIQARSSMQQKTEELRKELSIRIAFQNEKIVSSLKQLFYYITDGINI